MTGYKWDYKKVYTDEEKVAALKDLVKEAVDEQTSHYPRLDKSPYAGPAFDPRGFQYYHLDALLDALKNTDALLVLGNALNVLED